MAFADMIRTGRGSELRGKVRGKKREEGRGRGKREKKRKVEEALM